MLTYHLALISPTPAVSAESVMEVAAAIQRQVVRDFAPAWGVAATVEPFARLDQVPTGYWPIILRDSLRDPSEAGVHLDDHGQPLALVQANNVWSLSASHEAMEMLADPYGNRLIPGGPLMAGQGVVEYLVEVADPVASVANGYSVNGILVSDFVTPQYFSHPAAVPGTNYSFTGAVPRPRDVVDGGYVTWREPVTAHWWRATRVAGDLQFSDLGRIDRREPGLRRAVDSLSTPDHLIIGVPEDDPYLRAARARYDGEVVASTARAAAWERLIAPMVSERRGSVPWESNSERRPHRHVRQHGQDHHHGHH
jgi:hypothetical protein